MIRVGILGATGYTALELMKLLLRHPHVEIIALSTRKDGSPNVTDIHPQLVGRLDLPLKQITAADMQASCDCIFSCLPHGASASAIASVVGGKAKVVDFSADYRIWNVQTYEKWYGVTHPDAGRLGKVAYGLPELFREQIQGADLVANPGCYPTSAILAMAPLLKAGLVQTGDIIFDSKSGVSGAGRTPKLLTHYPECNESLQAYGVGAHRHQPEISQILSAATANSDPCDVIFTPHLTPMDRGILTTGYATLSEAAAGASTETIVGALRDFYADEPFITVRDDLPATKDVAHTNRCHVTARVVGSRVVTISCIDNLIKGASGAAVQNMNLMFGHDETEGLV